MRNFKSVILVLALFTLPAISGAANSKSTWAEIFSNKKLDVTTEYALGGHQLADLCLNGNQLQTKTAVKLCVEFSNSTCRPHQWPCETKCLRYETKHDIVARNYTVESCARYVQPITVHYPDCAETQLKDVHIPDTVNASVHQKIGPWGGESGSYYLFTKSYQFPSCN